MFMMVLSILIIVPTNKNNKDTVCEIVSNIYTGLCPRFLTQSSYNLCDLLRDKEARRIFCSSIWSLTPVPDTGLLTPFNFLSNTGDWSILQRAPKFFGIPWVIGASSVLTRQLLVGSCIGPPAPGWGWSPERLWLEAWNFQPHSPSSGEGVETALIINYAYVMEQLHKSLNMGIEEVLGWWTHQG